MDQVKLILQERSVPFISNTFYNSTPPPSPLPPHPLTNGVQQVLQRVLGAGRPTGESDGAGTKEILVVEQRLVHPRHQHFLLQGEEEGRTPACHPTLSYILCGKPSRILGYCTYLTNKIISMDGSDAADLKNNHTQARCSEFFDPRWINTIFPYKITLMEDVSIFS